MVLMVLEVILVVLGVVLVVLGVVLRQCSEQMFGTDSVRNNVPSQHRLSLVCLGRYHVGVEISTSSSFWEGFWPFLAGFKWV